MNEELMDIFDEYDNPLGFTRLRKDVYIEGLWHRGVHIWIYTQNGEILLQLRSKNKKLFPSTWDISVAGGVNAGEIPIDAAIREVKEELGLEVKQEDLVFLEKKKLSFTFQNMINNEFSYIYVFNFEGNIENLTLEKKEVEKVKLHNFQSLLTELELKPDSYAPPKSYWYEMIEKLREIIKK